MKKELREKVWNKYNKHCAYCGKELLYSDMQVDHKRPIVMSHFKNIDVNHIDNLMPSCRRCNHYKRAWPLEEFRRLIKTLDAKIQKTYLAKVAVDFGIITFKPFDGVFYFEKYNKLKKINEDIVNAVNNSKVTMEELNTAFQYNKSDYNEIYGIPENTSVFCNNTDCGWKGILKECDVNIESGGWEYPSYRIPLCPKCGCDIEI